MPPTCTSCGKRAAVYKRRASGEFLCLRCLEKSLVKAMRRGLASLASPKYGEELAFISLRTSPLASSGAAYLLGLLARKYRNDVVVIGHSDTADVAAELIGSLTQRRPEVIYTNISPVEPGPVNEARAAAESIKDRRITVITPLTATDIILDTLIRLMIYGRRPCECALPRYLVGNAVVVSPLSRILLTDMNVFVVLKGLPVTQAEGVFSGVKGVSRIKNLIAELERRSPETVYRFVKFLETVLITGTVTIQNGGFSPNL